VNEQPAQLTLVDEAEDERGWHEWFLSLPLDPSAEPPQMPGAPWERSRLYEPHEKAA